MPGSGIFKCKPQNEREKWESGNPPSFSLLLKAMADEESSRLGQNEKTPSTAGRSGKAETGPRTAPGRVAENENGSGISAAKLDAKTALETAGALPENVNYAVTVDKIEAAALPESGLRGTAALP